MTTQGREAAFESLFAALHPRLVKYARRRLDMDSAAEVAAEAMFMLWRKQADVGRDSSDPALNALAYRIVDGLVRNSERAAIRRGRLASRLARRVPDADEAFTDVAVSVAESTEATAVLMALPPADRRLISLLAAGLSAAEIALIMGISRGAAAMRLRRLRERLESAERRSESTQSEELPQ